MSEMTRAEYAIRVRRALGNMPAEHPAIADGELFEAIDNAPNRIIRANPHLFPEHHGRSWTQGPTEVPDGDADPPITGNRIPIPSNVYIIERVHRNESSTDPNTWASTQEIPVVYLTDPGTLGLYSKTTTDTGYPTVCCRKDSDLMYHPTTATGFECFFRLYGISREIPLTSDESTFTMDRDFDRAIILMAASEIAESITGMGERAMELLTMAGTRIAERGGVVAIERAKRPMQYVPAGMPPGLGGR